MMKNKIKDSDFTLPHNGSMGWGRGVELVEGLVGEGGSWGGWGLGGGG
jgi:hypothetical protein